MKKITPIALLVIRAEMRKMIIYFSIFFACLIMLASKAFTTITPGAEKQFIIDISFTWINIIGVLIMLVAATDVISGEEREKTDYYYRTNPVSDTELIVGKFLGAAGIVLLAATIMQLFYFVYMKILFNSFSIEQLKGFILMDFQLLLLVALGILASCLFTRFTSILFCISIYFTGLLSSYVVHLSENQHEHEVMLLSDKIAVLVYKLLPNFERFNVSESLIWDYPLEKGVFWGGVGYGSLVIAVLLGLAILLWKMRKALR